MASHYFVFLKMPMKVETLRPVLARQVLRFYILIFDKYHVVLLITVAWNIGTAICGHKSAKPINLIFITLTISSCQLIFQL